VKQFGNQKDAILFLIHVSPTMVEVTPEGGKSALNTALECAYDLLLEKIISNPNDMMGIILFGTVTLATFIF
jgi:ATP-dependent DNA helicase 2 subunit 1